MQFNPQYSSPCKTANERNVCRAHSHLGTTVWPASHMYTRGGSRVRHVQPRAYWAKGNMICPQAPAATGKDGVLPASPSWLYSGATEWSWRHWICSQSIQARPWLSPEASGVCQIQAARQQASLLWCLPCRDTWLSQRLPSLHLSELRCVPSALHLPGPAGAAPGCPCSVHAHSLPNDHSLKFSMFQPVYK